MRVTGVARLERACQRLAIAIVNNASRAMRGRRRSWVDTRTEVLTSRTVARGDLSLTHGTKHQSGSTEQVNSWEMEPKSPKGGTQFLSTNPSRLGPRGESLR